jgi:DNA-binding NtrC family response regulator
MNRVLIVDDDRSVRYALSVELKKNNLTPVEASSGLQAIELVKKNSFDSILLDVMMPDLNGIQTLQELKKIDQDVPIIIITGYADIPTAVEAIKLGAYDFLTKPPEMNRLILTINRSIEASELLKEVKHLDATMETSLEWIFGKSKTIKEVIRQIRQVAWSDFSVIIQGDTGTGKSVAAQAIHNLSKRAQKPFQAIDVGIIPETLIESELFGHEKGAFTGADKSKKGFFEMANSGTLFIDELENMPLTMQGKFLRAVEERKIHALGGTKSIDIDVRIIVATNTDVKQSVREKKLREDLFYRLCEFMIILPPLKERIEDIPFLANKFAAKTAIDLNKQTGAIENGTIDLLKKYPWPGNIRELKNVIRRAVLLSDDGIVKPEHLDFIIDDRWEDQRTHDTLMPLKDISSIAVRDAESKAIKQTLDSVKGNKTKAASILDIDYKTLLTKIKAYGINT